jgi:uncharacterized tellurite resistance protein B-like protein
MGDDTIDGKSGGSARMLRAVRDFFETRVLGAAEGDAGDADHDARLATAALLIEMTRADRTVTAEERQAVDDALREVFSLDEAETNELVRLAELELQDSASLFQFTHLIDKSFPLERKILVVEMLWRVAFSDACKDHHEEHLVRKIAELLHVPHSAFIMARHKVEARAGR